METHSKNADNLQEKFTILENIIHKKCELLKKNHYSGAEHVRIRDQETLLELESIYGILHVLNERINRLEK